MEKRLRSFLFRFLDRFIICQLWWMQVGNLSPTTSAARCGTLCWLTGWICGAAEDNDICLCVWGLFVAAFALHSVFPLRATRLDVPMSAPSCVMCLLLLQQQCFSAMIGRLFCRVGRVLLYRTLTMWQLLTQCIPLAGRVGNIYIYIYIWRERERERKREIYTHIYIYIYIIMECDMT